MGIWKFKAACRLLVGLALLGAAGVAGAATHEPPPDQTLGVLRPGEGRPQPFSFPSETDLEPLMVLQTPSVELTGFEEPLLMTVEGGTDVVVIQNDRAFRRRRTLVLPGDTVAVSARSPITLGTTEEIVVSVGDYETVWKVSTRDPNQIPAPFSFTSLEGQEPAAGVTSEIISLRGFEGELPATIHGEGQPFFRVNQGEWIRSGSVAAGDEVQLFATAPEEFGESREVVLAVGPRTTRWTVTTRGVGETVKFP
ncbi:hypothetical protein [Inquilinus sp. CAU 1745]|uniref:hypothetical protein n=1 Tax=Inquilinus sp. CAU 1745 TaxID=3140369 RepID=UPI00325C33C2